MAVIKKKIWAILKISYNPNEKKAEGGICGSCFFVGKNKFVTANHCFNPDILQPNKGYRKAKVLLANFDGKIIENPQIHLSKPKYDFAMGKVSKSVKEYFSLNNNSVSVSKEVYNFGYPNSRALRKYRISIKNNELKISDLTLNIEEQKGDIREVKIMTVNANDVKFSNLKVFLLNYTSEVGFSGGPLFSTDNSQLIGFMSMTIPPKDDPLKPVVAIPLCHWRALL